MADEVADDSGPVIEEYRQLTVVVPAANKCGSGTKVLFRFAGEKDAKDASVSFNEGQDWIPMLSVKKALDAFIDRYPIEL